MAMQECGRVVCWLRRDLRLYDHAALSAATQASGEVVVVFVFDRTILDLVCDRDDKRVTFIYDSLAEIAQTLRKHGSQLVVLDGDPALEIPTFAKSINAKAVYVNRDYEPSAIGRDAQVRALVESEGITFVDLKDQVIFDREEILTGVGTPHRVYTPYMKAWRANCKQVSLREHEVDLTKLCPQRDLNSFPELQTIEAYGFQRSNLWLTAGASAGCERLEKFIDIATDNYEGTRDFPALNATSGLSVHLRFGTISIRHAFRLGFSRSSNGAEKWVNELIWREFYQMILANFPHVVHSAFRPEFDQIEWPGTDEHFHAWCEGRTGYPIVDAAMRCLNETGWMHNRLRMVVASFLCKDLLVDWRRGEAYFARKLLDFELASNNGGWQWCASTGVDAQPTFRIFNPWLQSVKFDANGVFIREWLPELSQFSNRAIHQPNEASEFDQLAAGCKIDTDYPAPIVEHRTQRELALQLLRLPKYN